MSNVLRNFLVLTVLILLIMSFGATAQSELKSTGIGFRGSFYNSEDNSTGVSLSRHLGYSVNTSVNAGGCLYVFSRLTENTLIEFSIGSIASVEQVSSFVASQKVDVFNMTPIIFGFHYDFLQNQNRSALQPYLSAGLGAYVLSDVKLVNEILQNDVIVSTEVKPGLYLGTGLNINLTNWLALNLDGKYHMVKFNPNYKHSGFEFGLGFGFSWGSF